MRPWRWSTKIAQSIFVKHLHRTIFLSMGEAKFFHLAFLSEKFSYPNERMRFLTKGMEHKNRTRRMSRAPNSFNNMSRRESGYCDTYGLLIFNKLISIKNYVSGCFSRLNLA